METLDNQEQNNQHWSSAALQLRYWRRLDWGCGKMGTSERY